MKSLKDTINESLSSEQSFHLDSIIKSAVKNDNLDIEKPFFFMTRIAKKKEFHIYQCQGREQLEEYFEKTMKEPLEFGRFSMVSQDKEDLLAKTKLQTFRKDHYKVIEKI